MLTKSDIKKAENGDYASFFSVVKKTLEEKLEQNSFIKNSMNKVEYYRNLTQTLGESELESDDDEFDDDESDDDESDDDEFDD